VGRAAGSSLAVLPPWAASRGEAQLCTAACVPPQQS